MLSYQLVIQTDFLFQIYFVKRIDYIGKQDNCFGDGWYSVALSTWGKYLLKHFLRFSLKSYLKISFGKSLLHFFQIL